MYVKVFVNTTPAQAFADCDRQKSSVSVLGILQHYILIAVFDLSSKIFFRKHNFLYNHYLNTYYMNNNKDYNMNINTHDSRLTTDDIQNVGMCL